MIIHIVNTTTKIVCLCNANVFLVNSFYFQILDENGIFDTITICSFCIISLLHPYTLPGAPASLCQHPHFISRQDRTILQILINLHFLFPGPVFWRSWIGLLIDIKLPIISLILFQKCSLLLLRKIVHSEQYQLFMIPMWEYTMLYFHFMFVAVSLLLLVLSWG